MSPATPPRVEMYSSTWCPFCLMAQRLLRKKGVEATILSVDGDPERRAEMIARRASRTVPQIFVDDTHIGGCTDLYALEHEGGLDALLAGKAA